MYRNGENRRQFSCMQVIAHLSIPKRSKVVSLGFNGAETNCRIAHILGILLMNSYKIKICSEPHLFEVCPL